MNIWIDNVILNWSIGGCSSCFNGEDIQECYEYLNHAEHLIENHDNKFYIQDCIKNLKYVVDKRIKQIERVYDFKSYFPKQHILETYKELGIIKGFVIKKLFTIRNNIEHNELDYSNKEQCHDLLDTVWYFLKSTDNLVYESHTDNELYPDIDNENIWIEIDVKNPKINYAEIRGKVFEKTLSYTQEKDWIELNDVKLSNFSNNTVSITGEIKLTNKMKIILAKKFFINRILM